MAAPEGNRFWELRTKHGRDKLFESPESLWESACEYFEWCEENPFQEAQLVSFQGQSVLESVPKIRPFTWDGLETFLDVYSLRDYKTNAEYKDFSQVINRIDKIIRNQKFSGAASGFFNANIIARDLGLREQTDNRLTGANGGPIQTETVDYSDLTDDELATIAGIAARRKERAGP